MDNRVFNVNGHGEEMLARTIALALDQETFIERGLEGWRVDPQYGLLLYVYIPDTHKGDVNKFLAPTSPEQVAPLVIAWLNEQFDNEAKFEGGYIGWDADTDHDGTNERGWRCYVGDWGQVANDRGVACAVVPAWMWYGK